MINRVLRVEALIALDANSDLATLHLRDRAIGRQLGGTTTGPGARILGWARLREACVSDTTADAGRAEHAAMATIVVLGLVLGSAAATGVLWYDGSLQALAVALSLVLMLPPTLRGAVPGLGAVQRLLEAFSPGRLQRLAARWAPPAIRSSAERVLARTSAGERVYGRFRRWLTLLAGQVFGVAFNVGLVASYLAAVVFTDLAFGWSTTLDLDAGSVHALLAGLARPWAHWLPGAVPTVELVEASRHFRAAGASVADPALLGRWWTFVLLCLITYCALPRAVLLVVAVVRARSALAWTLTHLPGASELLYRLDHDAVETRAETPERARSFVAGSASAPAAGRAEGPASVVVWGDFDLDRAELDALVERATGLVSARVLGAGGATLEADAQAIRASAEFGQPVVLMVKSWEPLLGDLADFVADLRAALGEARPIHVVPLAARLASVPAAADVEAWRTQISRLGDPWLVLRQVPS
jgi:hypothetical protein